MRVEASLIHVRATASTLGNIARLRLRGAQQLIGKLGMTLWKLADDLECECEELDRPLIDAKLLEAEHAPDIDQQPSKLRRR